MRFVFFGLFLLLFVLPTSAESLRYSVDSQSDWVPYSNTGHPEYPGIFRELTGLILAQAGIGAIPVDVPTKRAIKLLQEGHIDFDWVNPDWFPDGNVGDGLVTSNAIFSMTEYVITLPKNAHKYQGLSDLHKKVVGTIRGFYYFDDKDFVRMDFSSEESLVQGLRLNRFEAAILEEMTARYWAKKLSVDVSFAAIHTRGDIVWRMRDEHQDLLPKINAVIKLLAQNGKVEGVFQRYRKAFVAQ